MENRDMRADVALVARGLASSREKARVLIEESLATVNGMRIEKPSQNIRENDVLAILGQAYPYVSRGGLKLEKALKVFDVNVAGLVCMDVGASTGGFTDVLLQSGARRVYAIDVGYGQLDPRLSHDSRVTNMERVNARALEASMFPELPTLGVMDVSFISIRLILPSALAVLGKSGRMISLVKPQFEAGRQYVGKGGIVSKPQIHRQVLSEIVDFMPSLGWSVRALDFSPISGGDGNIEFLADLVPAEDGDIRRRITADEIGEVVRRAHAAKLR